MFKPPATCSIFTLTSVPVSGCPLFAYVFCFAMALSADMLDSFILQYILALWLQQGLLPELFRRGGWDWRDGGCIFA